MTKLELGVTGVVGAVTAGAVILAVTTTHPKTATATPDYKALYAASQKQVITVTKQAAVLQAENTELTTQKTHFCSELTTAKIKDTLCQ